ncbi:hypothetical protein M3Y94_01139500 [Aphelenchoides besseyi]|nr:hypothetical protein M3Y94_01139500 [Aphelenchoides besseyi]KAI6227852.1 hypothetical protein M3Y95_00560200 [Aphelenchoides besseyi]
MSNSTSTTTTLDPQLAHQLKRFDVLVRWLGVCIVLFVLLIFTRIVMLTFKPTINKVLDSMIANRNKPKKKRVNNQTASTTGIASKRPQKRQEKSEKKKSKNVKSKKDVQLKSIPRRSKRKVAG